MTAAPEEYVKTLEGRVIHKSSSKVRVDTANGTLVCSLRGRLRGRSPVVVGDLARVLDVGAGEGVLEAVLPRRSELTRSTAGGREIAVAANMDRVLAVLSAREPVPRWPVADRIIVAAHRHDLEPAVAVNKWDRVRDEPAAAGEIRERLELFGALGYPTFEISSVTGEGLEGLAAWLRGAATVFSGHSGVGKSTLLRALKPGVKIETARVSERSGKGRHTTTAVTLYAMPFGGYVADTPGFREFALWGMEPREVGHFFREFEEHLSGCRFRDCLHVREPRCAVRQALDLGTISRSRYDSYLQMLVGLGVALPE